MKWFDKWFRKIHRWIAVPTGLLIPVAIVFKSMGSENLGFPQQLEAVQSLLMLSMAITGVYLCLLPYLTKWSRKKKNQGNGLISQKAQ